MGNRGGNLDYDQQALQQLIAEGDEDAFAILFNEYYTLLRPFVLKYTQSEADAEEILQETFIRIWLSRDKIPEIENLRAWIFTIASRQCLLAIRTNLNARKKIEALQRQESSRQSETPADAAQVAEITRLVAATVHRMPAQRRRIYRMSREQGMKPAAIAEALNLSPNTVKNTLVAALKEIRDQLAASGHLVSLVWLLRHFL